MSELYPLIEPDSRAMVFVDGENLALRFKSMLGASVIAADSGIWHLPDIAVWAQALSPSLNAIHTRVIRKYYYTSVKGDDKKLLTVTDWLKNRGFEIPRVFNRQGRACMCGLSLTD